MLIVLTTEELCMASSLKEMLLDKAVDSLLELIVDSSKEEIEALLNQKKLQKILHKSVCEFAQSAYFKHEFSHVAFIDDNEIVLSIPDDEINPAYTVSQIEQAISNIITVCFVTDDADVYTPISRGIAMIYLQKAKMTIQLHNILTVQRDGFETISDSIEDFKKLYIENRKHEIQLHREKEVLLKKELYNEVSPMVCDMMKQYLAYVTKSSPSFSGEEMNNLGQAMFERVEKTIDQLADHIDGNFCNKPVSILLVNGLESKNVTINFFVFAEQYFRKTILKNTERILTYKDIIDTETYVSILRLRNSVQSVLFPPLIEMGQINIISNTNNISIDVVFVQKTIAEIGNQLLEIYRNLMI